MTAHRRSAGALAVALVALVGLPACHEDAPAPPPGDAAASIDAPAADGGAEVASSLLAVDFTAEGCTELDPRIPRCRGRAPLTVTFVPVSSAGVSRFQWNFSDGSPMSFERTPVHTYTLPGRYDVELTGGGPAGTTSKPRPAYVYVDANPLGSPCDTDDQCESGLQCLCAGGSCGAAFPRGFCVSPCAPTCGGKAACADLTGGAPQGDPWRRTLCLPTCTKDADCAVGQRCRTAPAAAGGWTRVCFAPVPKGPGESCRSPAGVLEDTACVTKSCADLGALGLCTQSCRQVGCPTGSACADLGDGRALCLRACGAEEACDRDPLLACAEPGRAAPLGFTVRDHRPGTTYCAPKVCRQDAECGTAGTCRDGSCVRGG